MLIEYPLRDWVVRVLAFSCRLELFPEIRTGLLFIAIA